MDERLKREIISSPYIYDQSFSIECIIQILQTNVNDDFGRVMVDNLEKRGLTLAGIAACHSIEIQKKRCGTILITD